MRQLFLSRVDAVADRVLVHSEPLRGAPRAQVLLQIDLERGGQASGPVVVAGQGAELGADELPRPHRVGACQSGERDVLVERHGSLPPACEDRDTAGVERLIVAAAEAFDTRDGRAASGQHARESVRVQMELCERVPRPTVGPRRPARDQQAGARHKQGPRIRQGGSHLLSRAFERRERLAAGLVGPVMPDNEGEVRAVEVIAEPRARGLQVRELVAQDRLDRLRADRRRAADPALALVRVEPHQAGAQGLDELEGPIGAPLDRVCLFAIRQRVGANRLRPAVEEHRVTYVVGAQQRVERHAPTYELARVVRGGGRRLRLARRHVVADHVGEQAQHALGARVGGRPQVLFVQPRQLNMNRVGDIARDGWEPVRVRGVASDQLAKANVLAHCESVAPRGTRLRRAW